jgi:hypothetical protein
MLLSDRLSAFAYEPSWFVLVFDLVLFPFWMSAVLQRKSILKFSLWIFQIEDFLLIPGLVVFMFSFPRIGLLAVVIMFIYLGFLWVRRIYRKIIAWLIHKKKIKIKYTHLLKILLALVLIIIIISAIAGALIGTLKIASTRDFRYQLILDRFILNPFKNPDFSETGLIVLARSLAFYERTIFWFGGWNIFADYPLGVGLGNAGFYFIERMNSLAYGSYEIRNLLYQSTTIINTKSLWVRLLAETGIIGLAIFMSWIYILWRNSSLIRKSQDPIMKIVGLAGKFFVLAFLVEGFSVDSFAIPYTWVMAGIITAGRVIVQKELQNQIKPGDAEILEESTTPA